MLRPRSRDDASAARPAAPPVGRTQDRVAVSGDRLVRLEAGQVRFPFEWLRTRRGSRRKTMTQSVQEFLHRYLKGTRGSFLLHVLPAGFVRICDCESPANRGRTAKLARGRGLKPGRDALAEIDKPEGACQSSRA